MSEETELNEGDIIATAPEDFSFFDMLNGVTYPTDTVTVSLDEAAAHAARKLIRDFDAKDEHTDEELAAVQGKIAKLNKRLDDSKVTFHLRGVADDVVATAKDLVDERFMDKKKTVKDANGGLRKYLPEEEAMNYARALNSTVFSMHIEKVVYHKNGAEFRAPIDPDFIAAFYDKAPKGAQDKLTAAIHDLRLETQEYEASLDEGFFQKS